MVGTQNPLPWLSWADSNPLIVCNQTEKSVEPSLCPRCCQKQQVARILRFFTLTTPAEYPVSPQRLTSVAPAVFHLCRSDSKVIVKCQRCFTKLCYVSTNISAIIQSRCHFSVSFWIKVCFLCCSRSLPLGLTQCQFSRLCSPHRAPVESRYSVASFCAYLTHVACKYLNILHIRCSFYTLQTWSLTTDLPPE